MQKFYHPVTVVALVASAFLTMVYANELRFVSENIHVTLFPPDTVQVTGVYFFASSDSLSCRRPLLYPFPVDSAAEFPSFIDVEQYGRAQKLVFNRLEKAVSFVVDVPQGDTVALTVTYRQRFPVKTGRYILTTTAYWSRPLINCRYTLSTPVTTTIHYLSYDCDTVYTSGRNRVYAFFKERFMPDRDFVFMW